MMAPATAGAPSAMVAASTRRLAGQACLTGSLLRLINRAGLMIGSAVALGTLAAEFGQLSPEPGEEMIAHLLLALKRDLIRSIPCQILDTLGDLAGHIGNWDSASGLYQAALLCSFASPGTGPKGRNSLMMTGGSGGGSGLRTWQQAHISPEDALRIQNAANKTGQTIIVVGSRAEGKAKALSDWDYILTGSSRQRSRVRNSLPHGNSGGQIRGLLHSGADFWQTYNPKARGYTTLQKEKPHVIFSPQ